MFLKSKNNGGGKSKDEETNRSVYTSKYRGEHSSQHRASILITVGSGSDQAVSSDPGLDGSRSALPASSPCGSLTATSAVGQDVSRF